MGFTVEAGGRHGSGTSNTLIAFDDGSYIELIAFHQTNETHRWWKWKQAGGGFIDYCMRSNDLDKDIQHLAAAEVPYGSPYQLTRKRPDGYELDWEIAVPKDPRQSGAPFLIRDRSPRAERAPAYRGHANGVARIQRMVHAVDDIRLTAKWTRELTGARSEPIQRPDLLAEGLRVTVAANESTSSTIDFLTPMSAASPLASVLQARGVTPYSLEFVGNNASFTFTPELSHGARLSMAQ